MDRNGQDHQNRQAKGGPKITTEPVGEYAGLEAVPRLH
jgi:hypothetical protein